MNVFSTNTHSCERCNTYRRIWAKDVFRSEAKKEFPGVCIQRASCKLRSSDARFDHESNESNYENDKIQYLKQTLAQLYCLYRDFHIFDEGVAWKCSVSGVFIPAENCATA